MPEVAPIETPIESQLLDAPVTGSDDAAATPAFDEATYKKRIAGYTSAVNQAMAEAKAAAKERDELAAWKREREQAEMSEAQRLAARVAELEAEATAAKAQAAAATLAVKFPRAAELLGDDLSKFDPTRVAEIDGRLAKEAAEEASEPRVDPNSPRRAIAKPSGNPLEDAKAALTNAGNPFATDDWR